MKLSLLAKASIFCLAMAISYAFTVSNSCAQSPAPLSQVRSTRVPLSPEVQEKFEKAMAESNKRLATEHYVHGESDQAKSEVEKFSRTGSMLMQKNETEQALFAFTKAIRAAETPAEKALYKTEVMAKYKQSRNYLGRGACYLRFRDYSAAVKDLTEAIRICSDYSPPYISRAAAYEALGKKKAALSDREKAATLGLVPKFIAQHLKNDQGMKQAVDVLKNESNKRYYVPGKSGDSSKMESLYWQGRKLMDDGKYQAAIKCYGAAIKAFENPAEKALYKSKQMANYKYSWNFENRSYCYLMLKDYKSAVQDLSKAISMRPDYQENYINRGKALMFLGRKREAEADFEKAKHLTPGTLPTL